MVTMQYSRRNIYYSQHLDMPQLATLQNSCLKHQFPVGASSHSGLGRGLDDALDRLDTMGRSLSINKGSVCAPQLQVKQ